MFERIRMLLGLVVCLVAIAVPAQAAAGWTHSGEPLAEDVEAELSGPVSFSVGGAGAHFTAHLRGRWFGWFSSTGEYNSVTITACTGTGALSGLPCTGTVVGLPWTFHWVPFFGYSGKQITDVKYVFHFYSNQAHTNKVAEATLEGDVRATPDNSEAFSSFAFEGEGMTANGNPATLSGELAVSPAGTYGGE